MKKISHFDKKMKVIKIHHHSYRFFFYVNYFYENCYLFNKFLKYYPRFSDNYKSDFVSVSFSMKNSYPFIDSLIIFLVSFANFR